MILLDTHVLVFDALDPKRLSMPARDALEQGTDSGTLACSDISLWEIAMLVAHGRISPDTDAVQFLDDVVQARSIRVLPISTRVAVMAQSDAFEHGDPADRIIAATALAHRAKLVSRDARLRRLNLNVVDPSDPDAVDTGWNIEARTNGLWESVLGAGAIRTASPGGGSYRTDTAPGIQPGVTYDAMWRVSGRRVQLCLTKPALSSCLNSYLTVACANCRQGAIAQVWRSRRTCSVTRTSSALPYRTTLRTNSPARRILKSMAPLWGSAPVPVTTAAHRSSPRTGPRRQTHTIPCTLGWCS